MLVLLHWLRDLQAVVDINYDMQGSEYSGALLVYVCGWDTYRIYHGFLGAFSKLRRATVNLVMSVCLSARLSVSPHGTTLLQLTSIDKCSQTQLLIFVLI